MAKNFSKFLGKVALMTAAALWAGCNDSEKKTEEPVVLNNVKTVQSQNADAPQASVTETAESSTDASKVAESSVSVSDNVTEHPKDSLRKKVSRIKNVKSEMGMIRALYGVVEENMGRAVALYGVRPPREIIMPDGPREIHQPRPVARCYVKELTEEDVVVGEGSDIDVQTLLKVFRQRSPGIRHICNKEIYDENHRSERTKEFNGKIVLKIKIAPSGSVESVEIKSSTVEFSELVRNSVSRWKFLKTQNGGSFTFPIDLYEVFPSSSSRASEQPLSPTK